MTDAKDVSETLKAVAFMVKWCHDDTLHVTNESLKDILDHIATLTRERDDAVRDGESVRRARRFGNVVVEVTPELLENGAFTANPLHVMLTDNGDGMHSLTFRESDAVRDRERLDWLEDRLSYAMVHLDGHTMTSLPNTGHGWKDGKLREAIDAARTASE